MNDTPAQAPSVREAASALLNRILDIQHNTLGDPARLIVSPIDVWRGLIKDLSKALAAPIASRPIELPDIATALATIDAMKAGKPIAPGGIQAIVALAEEGSRQLDQFAIRFDADRRALAAWAAAHPELSAWVPERDDAIVWLMKLFDCRFSDPTVAKVNGVRARLGAARLRAPNQLTSDACDIIDQLVEALRKATRGEFIAQQRVAELERAVPGESALSDHLDALGLLSEAADRFREQEKIYLASAEAAMEAHRESSDTEHRRSLIASRNTAQDNAQLVGNLAKRIEAFISPPDHLPDLGALTASPSGADALAYGLARRRNEAAPVGKIDIWPDALNSEAESPAGQDDLHERLVDILGRELGDAYDCTRVWSAWDVGTMTADDFEPVSDRIDDIAAALVGVIKPDDLPEPTGEPIAMRKVETHRAGVVEQTTISTIYGKIEPEQPRVEHFEIKAGHAVRVDFEGRRYEGIAKEDGKVDLIELEGWVSPIIASTIEANAIKLDMEFPSGSFSVDRELDSYAGDDGRMIDVPIGGKNTLDYDRRQMEDRINAEMAQLGPEPNRFDCNPIVKSIAPGWEFDVEPRSWPPKITLTRYVPTKLI